MTGEAQIGHDGWSAFNIWEHSQSVAELYTKRARCEAEEMDSAAQAADLLEPLVCRDRKSKHTLLDVGCGTGYLFHSLRKRSIPVEYYGIDATERFIGIGKKILPSYGLDAGRLQCMRIEDLRAEVDHVICLNVLSNIDNYQKPLERLLLAAKCSVILRESVDEHGSYLYVKDEFLDPGCDLKVHVNTYPRREFVQFISSYGFEVNEVVDNRTRGKPELVINYPHHWKFFVATKRG